MAPFRLDQATLDRLIERYEALRNQDGMGSMLHRVSPAQRIDALQIFAAAFAAGRVPQGDQRDFWLAHLRPVLAETREAAGLLRAAFDQITPTEVSRSTATQSLRVGWQASKKQLRRWPSPTTLAVVAAILLAAVVIFLATPSPQPIPRSPVSTAPVTTVTPPPDTAAPVAGSPDLKTAYERFLQLTLTATERYGNEITPYALAAMLTGAEPKLGEPSFFLAEMMRVFPSDAAASIPRSTLGAMMLRHYAALAAAILIGENLSAFETYILDDGQLGATRRYDPATRLRDFAAAPSSVAPARLAGNETWPSWLRYLPLLILLPGVVWAFWGYSNRKRKLTATALRESRIAHAQFRRAGAGSWGTRSILQSSTDLPALPAASQTARQLLRLRETLPGSRLDLARSVRASLASAGDVVTITRDGSRAVDLVFLIRRRHRHDHERARVLRLLNGLTRNGVTLTAYDYAPDPRTLTATSRADPRNRREQQRTLDLRGLRELHGDSLLVIVSDGEDLVDAFSQKPHPFVRDELQLWSRRMLLTPVPAAEWGERELALAVALNAPVGRATMAGMSDLAWGLMPDAAHGAPRRILDRALRRPGFFERTRLWTSLARSMLPREDIAPRPLLIERLGLTLLQEMNPSDDEKAQLIVELKGWLGPGFLWFAACGIYPELRVDLTLWLGARLHRYGHPANPTIFSEELFDRLCLLPWFRACHMPDWLRTAAFEALSPREKTMARAAIDELVAGQGNQAGSRTLGLEVWQADWRGQPLSSDDVMIEFKGDRDPSPQRTDEDDAARDARSRWFVRGAGRTAIVAAWAAFATWLMPAFQSAPLAAGAWWPVLSFAGASAVMMAIVFACDRAGLFQVREGDGSDTVVMAPAPAASVQPASATSPRRAARRFRK